MSNGKYFPVWCFMVFEFGCCKRGERIYGFRTEEADMCADMELDFVHSLYYYAISNQIDECRRIDM